MPSWCCSWQIIVEFHQTDVMEFKSMRLWPLLRVFAFKFDQVDVSWLLILFTWASDAECWRMWNTSTLPGAVHDPFNRSTASSNLWNGRWKFLEVLQRNFQDSWRRFLEVDQRSRNVYFPFGLDSSALLNFDESPGTTLLGFCLPFWTLPPTSRSSFHFPLSFF